MACGGGPPASAISIKPDSDDDKFIDLVIARLEKSRDLFEIDFPPLKPILHVSIVRICAKEETFHSYGGTGGGVAGWVQPGQHRAGAVRRQKHQP